MVWVRVEFFQNVSANSLQNSRASRRDPNHLRKNPATEVYGSKKRRHPRNRLAIRPIGCYL